MASSIASNDTELLNMPTSMPGSSLDYPIVISSDDDDDDVRKNGWRVTSPLPFPDLDAFTSAKSQSPNTVFQNVFNNPVEISDDEDVAPIAGAPEIIIPSRNK